MEILKKWPDKAEFARSAPEMEISLVLLWVSSIANQYTDPVPLNVL